MSESSYQYKSRGDGRKTRAAPSQGGGVAYEDNRGARGPIQKKGSCAYEDNREMAGLIQKKENNTGLPDNLKSGIENLSGHSMDDVNVHYNSPKPAQLQAHAYAQGTDIHLASGQERHLPHEAWHVVQQKQGRVQPTIQMKGEVSINDDGGLEREADVMGAKALQMKAESKDGKSRAAATDVSRKQVGDHSTSQFVDNRPESIMQRKIQPLANDSPHVTNIPVIQMAPNTPMTKHYLRGQTLTVMRPNLERGVDSKLTNPPYAAGLPASIRGILDAGAQAAGAALKLLIPGLLAPLRTAMEDHEDVWEENFNDILAAEWTTNKATAPITGFIANVTAARTEAIDKSTLIAGFLPQKSVDVTNHEAPIEIRMVAHENGIITPNQASGNNSVKAVISRLQQKIREYRNTAFALLNAGAAARLNAVVFTYTDTDLLIETAFDAERDAIKNELDAAEVPVNNLGTQATSFANYNDIANDMFGAIPAAVKAKMNDRMTELKGMTDAANMTNVKYLGKMIVGGDMAPLDAFSTLTPGDKRKLLSTLEYNNTFRNQFFNGAWSAAQLAAFIGDTSNLLGVMDKTDLTAGGGGGRLPHHLSEHGPQVPDGDAKGLAARKRGGVNSRWASFRVMNDCLSYVINTINGSTAGNDPYNTITGNLGGGGITVRQFLDQNVNYTETQFGAFLQVNRSPVVNAAAVGGYVAGLPNLGPTFNAAGVIAAVNTQFEVGLQLVKSHGSWNYAVITAFPR